MRVPTGIAYPVNPWGIADVVGHAEGRADDVSAKVQGRVSSPGVHICEIRLLVRLARQAQATQELFARACAGCHFCGRTRPDIVLLGRGEVGIGVPVWARRSLLRVKVKLSTVGLSIGLEVG